MAVYAGDGHVCNHCKKKIPFGATVCPYCGNDPDSYQTNQQKAAWEYQQAVKSAERRAKLDKASAEIDQRGCLGFLGHKIWSLIKTVLIIIVVILVISIIANNV